MSTIGYGDISPSTDLGKVAAILYLPLAVIALADAVSDVQMIGMHRYIRETDFSKLVDECLLRDAIREDPSEPNPSPVLTEAEFLIDQLLANELVDEAAVVAIQRQFKYICRKGNFESDDDRKLTPELCYEELRERAMQGKELSAGATAKDLGPDSRWKWGTYEEWRRHSWVPRVMAQRIVKDDTEKKMTLAQIEKKRGGQKQGMRTVVGARK